MDKIEIEKAFAVAISREIESHEFYKDVATKVADTSAKEVFEKLAAEEMKHMEALELLKSDPQAVMKFVAPESDYKVAEATDQPKLSTSMLPKDAVALAMKKEQQAVEFYRELAGETADSKMKEMFENLANMELQHKHWLENVFVEIGYPEAF